MFPPMSPLGERVRVEFENQQIERDARIQAQMSQNGSGFQRIRQMFSNLFRRDAAPNTRRLETLHERRAAPFGSK